MDFGIGFLSNNVMLPILDFFYGIVPSYGLAIVALTLVIRFAVYPLSAGSIRNMRRTRITQPLMQKRVKELQERHKDNPAKLQEEMSAVYKEFGNPLAGCLPVLLQMPVLFALFATLRGSPFSDINYTVNLQILPQEQIERVQPKAFATSPQNIYIADGEHYRISAIVPSGNSLAVGEKTKLEFQTVEGKPLKELIAEHPETSITLRWNITKGQERVQIDEAGNIEALQPGEATIQGTIPGIASEKGFLFIDALGRVGAFDADGKIHWDIVAMVIGFGLSLYLSQVISGQGASGNPQQDTVNKITPVIFSGMFLFFPLPAGVLMYMLIANIFQTLQTFVVSREPLPENLQKIVAASETKESEAKGREALPFEPGRSKKKASG
ncbi:membrane protein insertase YidC [Gloeocapsopsis dulcis]|uniref:Membrane protein insertase YidC n=1 Tax=Gloeocapsopsis dulcis AAB1 = 1H9 TaxID=1433147 RepID=A0A6N8FXF6_9CHRO|nr:membrane protein insertase YidC [Gloeocapsopsis dulcis]MUL37810.1 membrane protein insertase YidC [Gloeocapsopsis dulcis AAB1 = 1H9]WNN89771.1 membrane protein insertase YidC [Gloeocapsopsis dulcis]